MTIDLAIIACTGPVAHALLAPFLAVLEVHIVQQIDGLGVLRAAHQIHDFLLSVELLFAFRFPLSLNRARRRTFCG